MICIYGIKQCDTCRKALRWLDDNNISYEWQDVRVTPLHADQIHEWTQSLDWTTLVNKRSTTWRELDETARESLNETSVVDQLLATPTLIKRPVAVHDGGVTVGFSAKSYQALFA
ncbi:MAG: Spx/MgsR family RNA polymerase-binding regulatory protein [Pseudomonadota bacterium]